MQRGSRVFPVAGPVVVLSHTTPTMEKQLTHSF